MKLQHKKILIPKVKLQRAYRVEKLMDFLSIQALTTDDMVKVDQKILAQFNSQVALINQLGFYIVNGGGKRIRPMLAILSAQALNYQGEKHIDAAAFIELIHTATLLHDDVVDESSLRRGKKTANYLFGNAASVLVGDYIYTRSFEMMTELDSLPILKLMSQATNIIAEGEVLQLMNCNDPNTSEENYMQVIYSKTARLFEAATQISAILSEAPKDIELALQNYGRYLGTAFQLIDDYMDYRSQDDEMGKNAGDDLAEGKPTLPLLHAMKHGSSLQIELIREAISSGNGMNKFHEILACLDELGSLEYTKLRAKQEADKAIEALAPLQDSLAKDALIELAKIAVERKA